MIVQILEVFGCNQRHSVSADGGNHVSRHSHETASSGKRSEGAAGCRVDRLERMELMPLLGKQVLGSKADYSLGPIGKDLSRQFQWRSMVSFEDLWVKTFWSLLRASSRCGMEPHGLRDRP